MLDGDCWKVMMAAAKTIDDGSCDDFPEAVDATTRVRAHHCLDDGSGNDHHDGSDVEDADTDEILHAS